MNILNVTNCTKVYNTSEDGFRVSYNTYSHSARSNFYAQIYNARFDLDYMPKIDIERLSIEVELL